MRTHVFGDSPIKFCCEIINNFANGEHLIFYKFKFGEGWRVSHTIYLF